MLYSGKSFTLTRDGDVLELKFDSQAEKVNVFHKAALVEFGEALDIIEKESNVVGLVMTSGKSVFVAGADITEFLDYFAGPDSELQGMLDNVNGMFNRFEDLPFPTVCAINGEAQGGGFEVCLAADYRIASPNARVGLPEVKLGIMPGWGGSIRLPRLIGTDNAVEWMCTGNPKRAAAALKDGAVDGVVAAELLLPSALNIVEEVRLGKRDYLQRRARKKSPIGLSKMEATMSIESAKGVVGAKAGPHYPSPMTIIDTLAKNAGKSRDEALALESENFIKLARTDVAECLVGIYLNDSQLKRIARKQSKDAAPVKQTAVLGAGIMGGGVAYQSASNGVPIVMKDIRSEAIDAGLEEVGKLLKKQILRGKIKAEGMAKVLNAIQPALSYGEFEHVDLVVEAVVENPKIKMAVLAEVEGEVTDDTIITTNTSTISVDLLSSALKRPENFCGMHFFNPVHLMPLVEIIRAKTSSEKAIATTVAYAKAMKKTPIVVNDCPGFLVNRILFAYFGGFNKLVADGASIAAIDKAMERFGWPMGPAYLLDVVGLDTGKHAAAVMAEGFPDRMAMHDKTVIDAMFEAERFGQKNGKGFYRYEIDRKGKPKKLPDPEGDAVVASVQSQQLEIEAEAIVDRMMIPLCIESARCLEDNIVSTAAEVDMGLVYGIGFPPFRGGALKYIDKMGLDEFCRRADALEHLGPLYQPTDHLRKMMKFGQQFHGSEAANAGAQA
ncbi:MAG: fatty acid oxidation complex subunit alpha FadB [Granulosicoccus sp.]